MSQNIIKRIDDMGSRIDELETSIADLMQQVRRLGLHRQLFVEPRSLKLFFSGCTG